MSLIALLGVLCVLLVVKESVASKTASFKTNIARKYAGAFFALSTPFFVPSSIPRASAIAGVRTVAPDRVQDNTLADQLKKDRLKEMLRDRLVSCGWRDELKEFCKDVIRRKGLEKVTVEELVAEITPQGRATIPEEIKAELLKRIRTFLQAT